MSTAYITPAMLISAPTGVPWSMVPWPKASSAEQAAEQSNVCWRASGQVDGFCNQTLRATLDSEQVQGPDFRVTVDPSGVARVILARGPILEVHGGRVSARAAFPRQWETIPVDSVVPEQPPVGLYGSSGYGAAGAGRPVALVAPGHVSWAAGRNGCTVELFYTNGWPHSGTAAEVAAGSAAVRVDDVTGMTGAQVFVYDGADSETAVVADAAADTQIALPTGTLVDAGPGTLTLAEPLAFAHASGVVVSAIPQDVLWACTLYAAAQVLESGATAVTIQSVSGSQTSGGRGVDDLVAQAEKILAPYRRVI